jgi:dihydrofolate reductase
MRHPFYPYATRNLLAHHMRKIRIMEHISLGGVIQHEEGEGFAHGNWTTPYRTPPGLAAVVEAYGNSFDLLLGRRTYDAWAGFWPLAGDSPIANGLNAATK